MKTLKRITIIGLTIEGLGFVLSIICVLLQKQVPALVSVLIFVGLITTLVSSFLFRKKLASEYNNNDKVFNKQILFSVIVLAVLFLLTVLLVNLH